MTIDELLNFSNLKPLPLRAWLSPGDLAGASWRLKDDWKGAGEKPILCGVELKLLNLTDDLQCVAVKGHAVAAGTYRTMRAKHLRAFVYLLNPADPCVRETLESWAHHKFIVVHSAPGVHASSPGKDDAAALEACRLHEGDEIISDFITNELVELWQQDELEDVVRVGLGIDCQLFCAIVETPMLCASLRPPLTQDEMDAYDAHQANKFDLEGIAS